jgi:hypothetical protein
MTHNSLICRAGLDTARILIRGSDRFMTVFAYHQRRPSEASGSSTSSPILQQFRQDSRKGTICGITNPQVRQSHA